MIRIHLKDSESTTDGTATLTGPANVLLESWLPSGETVALTNGEYHIVGTSLEQTSPQIGEFYIALWFVVPIAFLLGLRYLLRSA